MPDTLAVQLSNSGYCYYKLQEQLLKCKQLSYKGLSPTLLGTMAISPLQNREVDTVIGSPNRASS
jgi:hypothetical protein